MSRRQSVEAGKRDNARRSRCNALPGKISPAPRDAQRLSIRAEGMRRRRWRRRSNLADNFRLDFVPTPDFALNTAGCGDHAGSGRGKGPARQPEKAAMHRIDDIARAIIDRPSNIRAWQQVPWG